MHYYRNAEVAKLYHVSLSAVSHWIDAASRGRNDLEIIEEDGKHFIAETEKNRLVMSRIVAEGKKYINSRSRKVVEPVADFYKLYSQKEIFDIFSQITVYREVPLQYTYFDNGADTWDEYAHKLLKEDSPNLLTSTIELLELSKDYITKLVRQHKRVNVIDLGVGNALPVKGLIAHLLGLGVLNRYIAIDDSKRMLEIAERNINEWFDGQVAFESYVRDIAVDRFDDLVSGDSFDDSDSINLITLFGGTLTNLRRPDDALRTINNSMQPGDMLIYARKLDTVSSRRYFDFDLSRHKRMLNLLGIDESLYEVEREYDSSKKVRIIRIRLNVTLAIRATFGERTRTISLDKGDSVLIWRSWHQTGRDVTNQFYDNGFNILLTSQTDGHNQLQVIADIEADR